MALNSTGPISLGGSTVGQSINLELGLTATAQISLNDATVRTLLGISSGAISLSNAYGKTRYTPITPTVRFNSVANNGDTFVAVGESGNIFRSPDKGATWYKSVSGTGGELKRVSYNSRAACFIAVGPVTMMYSYDGITWTINPDTNINTNMSQINFATLTNSGYSIIGGQNVNGTSAYRENLGTNVTGDYSITGNTAGLSGELVDYYGSGGSTTGEALASRNGQIYYKTNSLSTLSWSMFGHWSNVTITTINSMAGATVSGVDYMYAVGNMGATIRYVSFGGTMYQLSYPGQFGNLYRIKTLDSTLMCAVGASGTMIAWQASGGVNPAIMNLSLSSLGQDLYDIAGSATIGYVLVGSSGTILRASTLSGPWTSYTAAYTL